MILIIYTCFFVVFFSGCSTHEPVGKSKLVDQDSSLGRSKEIAQDMCSCFEEASFVDFQTAIQSHKTVDYCIRDVQKKYPNQSVVEIKQSQQKSMGCENQMHRKIDQRLSELQKVEKFKVSLLQKLKANLENLNIREGKILLSPNNLRILIPTSSLFQEGSDNLHPAAFGVLTDITEALEGEPVNIMVEGHADNDGSAEGRNWELSSLRAVSVVRQMRSKKGRDLLPIIRGESITAKGMGHFKPMDENATAWNSRIEIILTPITETGELIANRLQSSQGEIFEQALLKAARDVSRYEGACNKGDMASCSWLGNIYSEEAGGQKNYKKAIGFFEKSCDGKYMAACTNLAAMYYNGKGVKKDLSKVVSLLQQACDGDNMNACNFLGWMYYDGEGVSRDLSKAKQLLQKACDGDKTYCN